jgi:L-fuconolactonase
MKIDAHHHFWHYNTRDYGWISDEMAVLRRDFLPADLKPELDRAGIDRVVSVQARQCVEETEWLLKLAEENDFIAGVVGWLPIASPEFPALLEQFAANPKLRAIRHVVQDEPDDRFILGEAFNRGIDRLLSAHLVYDILIFERHLPYAIEFVKNHSPEQVFVLDHIAKPKIAAGEMQPWADNLRKLAAFPNVFCKLSGLVTEADIRSWTPDQLRPYVETVLDAFEPGRVMFGSDWPVCTCATNYSAWRGLVGDFISRLSEHEQAQIMGGTALKAYFGG